MDINYEWLLCVRKLNNKSDRNISVHEEQCLERHLWTIITINKQGMSFNDSTK
jgi:hypothetical protein